MKLRARVLLVLLVLALVPVAVLVAQRCASGTVATERIFAAIGVREGITVCEMGAGNGELSMAAAKIVGPDGRIYTSELGDDRVKTLRERTAASGLVQITVVAGDAVKTNFPEGACDALFMRNVYHHFADPAAMNASILASVKPGAKVAVVDFSPPNDEASSPADRGNDGMHGIKAETLAKELQAAGFETVTTEAGDQRWFMVVAARPAR
jgi:ubiquinone/menaquinone biosynthesis C-methylase UbiE